MGFWSGARLGVLSVAVAVLVLILVPAAESAGVASPAGASASGMWTLTVSFQGQGRGFVLGGGSPEPISCATTCSAQFPDDIGPVLGVVVATGSSFGGFSGNCSGIEHEPTACQLFHTAGLGDQTVEVTFNVKPPPCIAPAVADSTVVSARKRIEQSHCGVGSVTRIVSSTVKRGRVISQSPPGKWQNKPGSPVDLVVSKGKPPLRTDAVIAPILSPPAIPGLQAIATGESAGASAPVTLTVSTMGLGEGWVTSDPAGISCAAIGAFTADEPTICSAQFPSGTEVTLTAQTANGPGYLAEKWAGWTSESGAKCIPPVGPPPQPGTSQCQVSLDTSSGDTTVGATFHSVAVCITTTDLRGKTVANAELFLMNHKCRPGKIRYAFSSKPKGRVITQNPPSAGGEPEGRSTSYSARDDGVPDARLCDASGVIPEHWPRRAALGLVTAR